VLRGRAGRSGYDPYDGDLTGAASELAQRFGPGYGWSATRLETYGVCPFYGFLANGLGLKPREEPAAGLDVRQLGSIYHRILERLYLSAPDPAELDCLLDCLPGVAGAVLDAAPAREGFRPNAWWEQTRREIVTTLGDSIRALEEGSRAGGWVIELPPERRFLKPPLIVSDGDDSFRVRGVIDRIDRAADGRRRVIDYKTGGPSDYQPEALAEGKKLQLAIYALAVRDVFDCELPAEGFYWHIGKAEPSPLALGSYEGGPSAALADGAAAMWRIVGAVRGGEYPAGTPRGGCPDYCPGASFCWHYRPRFRA
jgi:RecB family exonuclease